MPTVVQFRRGTTAQNDVFVGAAGELSVDTEKDTLRVHDGTTAGGYELLTLDATQTITNKTPNQDWVPASDSAYDLGSPTNKWKDLYLSGNSIYLGDAKITSLDSAVILPTGSTILGGGSVLDSDKANALITSAINNLVDGAPTALDTLNELAAALDDDANFAATITNQLAALPDSAQVSAIITADVDQDFVNALNVNADTLDGQQGTHYLDYTNFTNTPNILDSANVSSIIVADVDQDFVNALNVNADTLDGQDANYYLDYTNFTNTPNVLDSGDVRNIFSAAGDLTYNSSTGEFSIDVETVYTKSNFDSDLDLAFATNAVTTTDLAEGSNLYYTTARADSDAKNAVSAGTGLSYNNATGEFSVPASGVTAGTYGSASLVPIITVDAQGFVDSVGEVSVAGVSSFDYDSATGQLVINTADGGTFAQTVTLDPFTTTDLSEGNNLYYTTTRADSDFDARLTTKTTDDVAEGTNLYYTKARVDSDVTAGIDALVAGAPTALDTLNELAAALDDDPNFAATITAQLSALPDSDQVRTLVSAVDAGGDGSFSYNSSTGEFTYTGPSASEVRAHLSAAGDLSYNSGTGEFSVTTYKSTDFDTDFSGKSTTDLSEGNNLYYTTARADSDAKNAVSATDAGGDGSFSYNSSTGVFTYTGPSAAEARAHFSASGDLSYNSTTGDFSVTTYKTADFNTDFGNKTTTDLTEGNNLYYTTLRADSDARHAISVTDAGGDGSFSYNVSTGELTYTGPSAAEARAHFSGGTGITYNSSTGEFTTTDNEIVHDNLSGFVANEHIDHSGVSITAGSGLTGGGNITASRTLNIGQGTGITVSADAISTNDAQIVHDNLSGFVANEHIDHSNVTLTAGAGLTGGGDITSSRTFNIGAGTGITVNADDVAVDMSAFTTTNLAEGNNLYYTTARADSDAKNAVSASGDLSYDPETGVFSITVADVALSDSGVRSKLSAVDAGGDGSFSYNQSTGEFTYTGPSAAEVRAHFSEGTGVSISSGQISIGQDVSTTADVTFNSIETTNGLVVGGDLQVNGTTTTVNSQNLSIEDNMIYLNQLESAGSPTLSVDIGWAGNYNDDGTYAHAGMFRDATDNTFKVYQGYTPEPDSGFEINTGHGSFELAPFSAGTLSGKYLGFDSDFGDKSTSDLTEGSNLYYTTARADSDAKNAVSAGTGISYNASTGVISSNDGQIVHDNLSGFVSNEHVNHSSVSITAGAGLTGGGDITASRTLNVVGGGGINVNADNITIDSAEIRALVSGSTGITYNSGTGVFTTNDGQIVHDNLSGFVANEHIDHSGVSITAGSGLTGGGNITTSRTLNIGEGTGITVSADAISTNDAEIVHDNLSGFVANEHIDHSAVSITAGSGLTGGGTIATTRTLNIGEGTGITVSADAISTNDAEIVHDNLSGFVANEHIDHSAVSITAGNGLTGGGTIAASRTLNIVGGGGITVNADNITIDSADIRALFSGSSGIDYSSQTGTFTHSDTSSASSVNNSGNTFIQDITIDGNGHVTAIGSGTVTVNDATITVSAGVGLSGGGNFTTNQGSNETLTLTLDMSELTDMTATMVGTDEFIVLDAGADRRKAANEIGLSIFNNDAGFTTYDSSNATGQIDTAIANLIDNAPAALDTLNELAAALGDDANFSTTVTNAIAALPDSAQVRGLLSGSTGITYNSTTGAISTNDGQIVHDNLSGFVSNEHINHSGVSITAGNGLTGGGDITSTRTLNVGAGSYIIVNADDIDVDATSANTASKVVARDGSGNFSAGTITATLSGNASTATTATNVTATANNSTNETTYLTFVDGATGAQGIETDTGLTYNPSTGVLSSVDFNSTSDVSLKENIETINDAANKVNALRGVNFNWKDNSRYAMGVIAQEVEQVIPEVVATKEDGTKTVSYGAMVGLLIEAVKDLQNQIDQLKK